MDLRVNSQTKNSTVLRFAYRVLFVAKTANRKGQADEVIEFVKAGSALAKNVNKKYAIIKED